MINSKIIALSYIILTLLVSCSSDDDLTEKTEPIPPVVKPTPPPVNPAVNNVVFSSLVASKKISFTDEPIVVTIDGSNFKNVNIKASNPSITIKEITSTSYELTATEAVNSNINVQLIDGESIRTKTINIDFVAHGVFNSSIVEGIEINVDNKEKVRELLGEPDGIRTGTNADSWLYSKGYQFIISKTSNRVLGSFIFSTDTFLNVDGGGVLAVSPYPYLINNTFDISDSRRNTMDEVVSAFGEPEITFVADDNQPRPSSNYKEEVIAATESEQGLYQYVYVNNGSLLTFRFRSDNIDNFEGKEIDNIFID